MAGLGVGVLPLLLEELVGVAPPSPPPPAAEDVIEDQSAVAHGHKVVAGPQGLTLATADDPGWVASDLACTAELCSLKVMAEEGSRISLISTISPGPDPGSC